MSDPKLVNEHILSQIGLSQQRWPSGILNDALHPIDKMCPLGVQAGVRYSVENIEEVNDITIIEFITSLEAARKEVIKDFVIASSSSVYGIDITFEIK